MGWRAVLLAHLVVVNSVLFASTRLVERHQREVLRQYQQIIIESAPARRDFGVLTAVAGPLPEKRCAFYRPSPKGRVGT